MSSRLSSTFEKKTRKRLFWNVVGTIIILFLVIKYAIPFLLNLNIFFAKDQGITSKTQANSVYIGPPLLLSSFNATNSASITVSGTATAGLSVKLFLNDTFFDTTTVKSDGTFSFPSVKLSDGANTLKAKASKDTSESDYSNNLTITLASKAPNLTVDSPSDGQSFPHDQSTVTVRGKSDPNDKVTVNDFWAISDNSGNYSYVLKLQNGDNQIKVIATDDAGNKTEKDLKVTYSQ